MKDISDGQLWDDGLFRDAGQSDLAIDPIYPDIGQINRGWITVSLMDFNHLYPGPGNMFPVLGVNG
jgi:hypothetical protein